MHLRILPLLALTTLTLSISAQVNSPYSRYGLGNMYPGSFTAANGMGGFSAANFSPSAINFLNPASFAEIGGASFDVGVYGTVMSLNTNSETFTSGDANLSNMAFAFPVYKNLRRDRFGLSFGLVPFSTFQYDILEETDTGDPDLGTKQYNYVGAGQLYQLYGGFGYRHQTDTVSQVKSIQGRQDTVISAGFLSIGASSALLFGSLYNTTYASFPDILNSQTTKLSRDNDVNGGMYNIGVGYQKQYVRKHGTKRDILNWKFGGTFSPQVDVHGTQSILWTNILKYGNYETVTDTLYTAPDTSGNIHMPMSYSAGLSFSFFSSDDENKNQFTLGLQYASTMWSQYDGFQDAGELADSWRATLGAEFIPKKKQDQNAPLMYRFGAYTGKSNLIIDGVQLNDVGFSAGLAIPMGYGENVLPYYRNSKINMFLNVGQRGANADISETYFNFGVGFSMIDLGWFMKYKLN